jgi:hypothetical protein
MTFFVVLKRLIMFINSKKYLPYEIPGTTTYPLLFPLISVFLLYNQYIIIRHGAPHESRNNNGYQQMHTPTQQDIAGTNKTV